MTASPTAKTAPEASAPGAVSAEKDPNEMVSVFNKNPQHGDFVHPVYKVDKDEEGKPRRAETAVYRAEAGAFSKVPRWLAEKWKRMFPGIIVDPEGVGAPRSHQPSSVEVAQLRQQNSDLTDRLKNLEKLVQDLRG